MKAEDWIRQKLEQGHYFLTLHAQAELIEDNFSHEDLVAGLRTGKLIEDYPEARRGACCLINGVAMDRRPIHIVCTRGGDTLVVITVYEPTPPKWTSPEERGRHQ